jgi:UTP--glucose-1-phosphate uridylyltransferase
VPKELLPVFDRPALHYVLMEAVDAGMSRIVVVTARGKGALRRYLAPNSRLDAVVKDFSAGQALEELRSIRDRCEVIFVSQPRQRGLGDAILCARDAVGNAPFSVLLPDTLLVGDGPAIAQVASLAERHNACAFLVAPVPWETVPAVGIVDAKDIGGGVYRVRALVEKPPAGRAPSNLAIVGRYVLTPDIFQALRRLARRANGEVQLTDAIASLLPGRAVYAQAISSAWYDTGTPLGLLHASVSLALRSPYAAPQVHTWIRQWAKEA